MPLGTSLSCIFQTVNFLVPYDVHCVGETKNNIIQTFALLGHLLIDFFIIAF
jgi:hypothetical protein